MGAATDGQRAFVSAGQLLAIDAAGRIAWRFPSQMTPDDYIAGRPSVRGGIVYVAGPHSLLALRAYP
jgi:hypothetical protein